MVMLFESLKKIRQRYTEIITQYIEGTYGYIDFTGFYLSDMNIGINIYQPLGNTFLLTQFFQAPSYLFQKLIIAPIVIHETK